MWRCLLLLVCCWSLPWRAAAVCAGDCNLDGEVTIDEILRGVNLAVGSGELSECSAMDRDASGEVTVDEIVSAVNAALAGCPLEATPTPSATATPDNQPPAIRPPAVYRGYIGFPIALSLDVVDPDGDGVSCAADMLPDGAVFDSRTLLLSWTPGDEQIGPQYAAVTCTDDAANAAAATVLLPFSIRAVDNCTQPSCDPAAGCSSALRGLDAPCCDGEAPLYDEPQADCPAGLTLLIADDTENGIDVLSNCELKAVLNFAQTGAQVRLRVLTRCISLDDRARVRGRMETSQRVMFTREYLVPFTDAGNGYVKSPVIPFQVDPPAPFFDIQDSEANLTITLRDAQNREVSQSVRLLLTFTPIPQSAARAESEPTPTPQR